MGRMIGIFFVGVVVSCYFFPFGFTFLPQSVNTKIILAALSAPLIILDVFRTRNTVITQKLAIASLIAILFSATCYISVAYNNTNDYSYATYFFSFFTWLGGAYVVCAYIRWFHKTLNIKIITFYLAGVCTFQCYIAIAIDQIPALQMLVDAIIFQGSDFLQEVNRLYGIGAQLDTAGTRFSITLIMIAAVLTTDEKVKKNKKQIYRLLIAYFTIAMLGNIISRTTSIGLIISMSIFFLSSGIHRLVIYGRNVKLYGILFLSVIVALFVFTYLYNTDPYFHKQLRYGFEGLFNWLETGVWRTDSTDKLNAVMWVWPTDTKTWLIGSGWFSNFHFSTDIGYCRFVLYCGLIGFSFLAFLFIYNPYIFSKKYSNYWVMFLALMLLSFIIWLKVATDIFLIYALFYCFTKKDDANEVLQTEVAS